MKKIHLTIFVSIFLFCSISCNTKEPKSIEEKKVMHLTALANIMTEGKDDCYKTATEILKWSHKNAYEFGILKLTKNTNYKNGEFKSKIQMIMPVIIEESLKCAKSSAFNEAMESIK
jgi:hypothetical protein